MTLVAFHHEPTWSALRPARSAHDVASPYSVEFHRDFEAAREAWMELDELAPASPYQSFEFCRNWSQTVGAGLGIKPLLVVIRNGVGEVLGLLPLGSYRIGPLTAATLLGGRMANFQMALFRPGPPWGREAVENLLRDIGKRAGFDLYGFINQPLHWRGYENPIAFLPNQASPSFAYSSALPDDFQTWFDGHFSSASQKKFRKKAKRLEAIGPVRHLLVTEPSQRATVLSTFLAQKRLRMRALGLDNDFDNPRTVELLRRLLALDRADDKPASLELHALLAGDRIVSIFGGFVGLSRLSGLIISFDFDRAVAASSPGELLIIEIVRDAIRRGLTAFDLGIGEARYKSECCETVEPLVDSALGVSRLGRLAAPAFLQARRAKRFVKQSPFLLTSARFAQRIIRAK